MKAGIFPVLEYWGLLLRHWKSTIRFNSILSLSSEFHWWNPPLNSLIVSGVYIYGSLFALRFIYAPMSITGSITVIEYHELLRIWQILTTQHFLKPFRKGFFPLIGSFGLLHLTSPPRESQGSLGKRHWAGTVGRCFVRTVAAGTVHWGVHWKPGK